MVQLHPFALKDLLELNSGEQTMDEPQPIAYAVMDHDGNVYKLYLAKNHSDEIVPIHRIVVPLYTGDVFLAQLINAQKLAYKEGYDKGYSTGLIENK